MLHLVVCTTLWAVVMATQSRALDDPSGSDPDQVVEYLNALRHGPARTTERGKELLQDLEQHPARYSEAVGRRLTLARSDDLADMNSKRAVELGAAMFLAQRLGPEHGTPLLLELLRSIAKAQDQARGNQDDKDADTARQKAVVHNLSIFEGSAMDLLRSANDRSAVEYALQRIEAAEPTTRSAMLRYLATVARGDKAAFERLRGIVERPNSALARDLQAHDTLRALQASLATQPATRDAR